MLLQYHLAGGKCATNSVGLASISNIADKDRISSVWPGSEAADEINLREGNEKAFGYGGSDRITGGAGNDVIDGGGGLDTAVFPGAHSRYVLSLGADALLVRDTSGADGTDTLVSVERLKFTDGAIAFDVDGAAGQAYRIYQAAFDRAPDVSGLGFWIKFLDDGMSLPNVAAGFMASQEFETLYGANPTDAEFIQKLYLNVLHRPGEGDGMAFWMTALANPEISRADVLAAFAESRENQTALIDVLEHGMFYQPFL